jgi:hypothetical protein
MMLAWWSVAGMKGPRKLEGDKKEVGREVSQSLHYLSASTELCPAFSMETA